MPGSPLSLFVLYGLCRQHLSPMRATDRSIRTAANEVIKSNDDPLMRGALRHADLLKGGGMEGCHLWRWIEEGD